jgi:hypothetical protein
MLAPKKSRKAITVLIAKPVADAAPWPLSEPGLQHTA